MRKRRLFDVINFRTMRAHREPFATSHSPTACGVGLIDVAFDRINVQDQPSTRLQMIPNRLSTANAAAVSVITEAIPPA